jgi:hypothetical protein
LAVKAKDIDLECEIIAKASQRHEFILEVPISYRPRTREQAKKTTPRDGLSAIAPLFRYRRAMPSERA